MRTEPELTAALTSQPGRYDIDPGRSSVSFRTRHMFGLAPVRGTFAVRAGTVDLDGPGAGPAIYAEIDTASFRTGNILRDGRVRSPHFLDATGHPVMIFSSDQVDDEDQVLTGTLTVRGVTRPVSLSIVHYAPSAGSFTVRATTRIDRTEYGVTAARGLAARHLDVTVEVRCVRN
jgi:polyisoprenoid-binding protein YceI